MSHGRNQAREKYFVFWRPFEVVLEIRQHLAVLHTLGIVRGEQELEHAVTKENDFDIEWYGVRL